PVRQRILATRRENYGISVMPAVIPTIQQGVPMIMRSRRISVVLPTNLQTNICWPQTSAETDLPNSHQTNVGEPSHPYQRDGGFREKDSLVEPEDLSANLNCAAAGASWGMTIYRTTSFSAPSAV